MNNLNFKFWILEESKKDIFGFEKETKEVKDVEEKYVIKVDKIKKFSENYNDVSEKVYTKFTSVVNFDEEYLKISKFIENLI
jgi:hypothetical protein